MADVKALDDDAPALRWWNKKPLFFRQLWMLIDAERE